MAFSLTDMVNDNSLVVDNIKTLIVSMVLFLANFHIHTQHVPLKSVQLLYFLSKGELVGLHKGSLTSTSTGISRE